MIVRKIKKYFYNFIILVTVVAFLFITVMPIYWTLSSSLMNSKNVFSPGAKYYPVGGINLQSYKDIILSKGFGRNFINSIMLALCSSFISTLLSFLGAYAYSRINYRFKHLIFYLIIASMLIPQISTVIPLFRFFKMIHLFDNLWGLVILHTGILIPFSSWIFVTFINRVPKEIEESALIDGTNIFGQLVRVVMPILKQSIGVIFLINFISSWNEMLFAIIFIMNRAQMPLTAALMKLSKVPIRAIPWDTLSAGSMIMIIPIIIISMLFQKQLVSGWTAGSLKE